MAEQKLTVNDYMITPLPELVQHPDFKVNTLQAVAKLNSIPADRAAEMLHQVWP